MIGNSTTNFVNKSLPGEKRGFEAAFGGDDGMNKMQKGMEKGVAGKDF